MPVVCKADARQSFAHLRDLRHLGTEGALYRLAVEVKDRVAVLDVFAVYHRLDGECVGRNEGAAVLNVLCLNGRLCALRAGAKQKDAQKQRSNKLFHSFTFLSYRMKR